MRRFRQRSGAISHIPQSDAIVSAISMDKSMHVNATPFQNRRATAGGYNKYAQFGMGSGIFSTSSTTGGLVTLPHGNWKQISTNTGTTIGLKWDGTLWGWGNTSQNAVPPPTLGTDSPQYFNASQLSSPIQISRANDWTSIIKNNDNGLGGFMAQNKKKEIWSWGYIRDYKGGKVVPSALYSSVTRSQNLSSLSPVAMAFGAKFGVAIGDASGNNGGFVYTWGRNDAYQLGNGVKSYVNQYYYNGQWYYSYVNQNRTVPTKVTSGFINDAENRPFKSVTAGISSAMVIDNKNRMWAWGNNNNRETGLGVGTITYPKLVPNHENWAWVATSSSAGVTLACKLDGTVWAVGNLSTGVAGVGSGGSSVTSSWVQIPGNWNTKVPAKFVSTAGFMLDNAGIMHISTTNATSARVFGITMLGAGGTFVPVPNKVPFMTFDVDRFTNSWIGN